MIVLEIFVTESHQRPNIQIPPSSQLVQQPLAAQQPFQAVSLSASAPFIPSITNSTAPFEHNLVPNSGQPLYAQPPAAQQVPSVVQPTGSNNQSAPSGKSNFTTMPPSIYPPVASSSSSPEGTQFLYQPVAHHWFYSVTRESKEFWEPFSVGDSVKLEEVFKLGMMNACCCVFTYV